MNSLLLRWSAPAPSRSGWRMLGLASLLLLGSGAVQTTLAADGPPPLMSFQTRVLDGVGSPLANGPREVIFRIFGVETGAGAALWAEKQTASVKDGYISVILGQGGPVPAEPNPPLSDVFNGTGDTERYIEIQVGDSRISPRLRLLPTAYSFVSGVALRLVDNSISSAMIQAGAVGGGALAAGAVTTGKLQDGSVTEPKIANGAVTSGKLADGAIGAAKLQNGSITTDKLADNAVNAAKIQDGAVGTADIANGSVTGDKLANGAVNNAKIQDGAVISSKLGDASVTLAKMSGNSVNSATIVDGGVATADVADGAVALAKLASNMFELVTYEVGSDITSSTTGLQTRLVSQWVPVIVGIDWGSGDLDEGGSGQFGGVFWTQSNGYWRLKAYLRTHNNHADPDVQVLWIPRRLVSM